MKQEELIKVILVYITISFTYFFPHINTILNLNELYSVILFLAILIVTFIAILYFTRHEKPIDFESRILFNDDRARIIFKFKNNKNKPVSIRWYQFEITQNDKTVFNNRHSYGRIINPNHQWQEESFDWATIDTYFKNRGENGQILSRVGFEIDGEEHILVSSWGGDVP